MQERQGSGRNVGRWRGAVVPVGAVAVAVVVGTAAAQCRGSNMFEQSAAIGQVYDREHIMGIV